VDVDIEALGGDRNLVKLGAFLIALGGVCLCLMLGLFGVFCQACDGVFFPVASGEGERWKQDRDQHFSIEGMRNHEIKNSRAAGSPNSDHRMRYNNMLRNRAGQLLR
jgi:hypothetical protein